MNQEVDVKVSKSRFHGLWALTNRELKKWYQQPFVFVMGIIQPVLWLALLGKALNISAIIPNNIPGVSQSAIMLATFGTTDYFSFMAMGMVAFTTVFTTAFTGMSVVWDKRLGFMNKVLSTPVSRTAIILAKVFAASMRAIFQATIVALVAFALGLVTGTNFAWWSILGVFAIVFLLSVGLASLFTALTLRATRLEMPQAIFQLITLPLMFASSAYFPIDKMPSWLQAVASVNPISYTIDAVRRLMIFSDGFGPLAMDFAFVGVFALVVTAICVVLSWRYLNR
ncbi:MAG: ABC transporter permease [Nitrososphaerota archaeon]|jgi:ABC-2 type transport system permease protein|uniref:ABC transporter permease n=1 Tax=Candidatus Bathycorpusculum sp. TaxID=2994959 RepID=UPI002837B057|nr:ABC transporter permease [Candidatus Termitimicrobium sp.]MDR0493507.1 ABC transporter permease [Nitrososphaerota archaeon]